jgi:hypothetical protein
VIDISNELAIIIVAIVSGVLGPATLKLLDMYMQYRKSKQLKLEMARELATNDDPLVAAISESEVIQNYVYDIRTQFKFDRVWVAMFHNGGHYYPTGKSIQKFSIFYESIDAGISSIRHQFTNIPVSLFTKTISEIFKNGYLYIANEEIADEYDLDTVMDSTGTKTSCIFAVKNLEGKFFGFIVFDNIRDADPLTEDMLNKLQSKIDILSGHLFESIHV